MLGKRKGAHAHLSLEWMLGIQSGDSPRGRHSGSPVPGERVKMSVVNLLLVSPASLSPAAL